MHCEVRHFARVGAARGARLTAGRFDGDVDLAQEEMRGGIGQGGWIGEREGEDVGRLVCLPVVAIQVPEEPVVRENDGERRARAAEEAERLHDERLKSCRP